LKRVLLIVVVVAVSLVLAGTSAGGNAVVTGHSAAPSVTSNLGTNSGPTSSATTGTLPFTGLDLAGITVVAALLLAGGVTLRRTARKQR
jgi:hypothetical protein